ncbi:hypothetical protein [Dictyobacter aurantiacus]|uniref:hypothetical protein n=1 Tax=Dictyobacter aurantiacus TaxID=1936993 RepID=UPI000F83CB76|nr:hypothetical protein [Dictyobacter aurantiacus]
MVDPVFAAGLHLFAPDKDIFVRFALTGFVYYGSDLQHLFLFQVGDPLIGVIERLTVQKQSRPIWAC